MQQYSCYIKNFKVLNLIEKNEIEIAMALFICSYISLKIIVKNLVKIV